MRNPQYTEIETTLTQSDCQAILCAFPLTALSAATISERSMYNNLFPSLSTKLTKCVRIYSEQEIEAMGFSVELALSVISGNRPDLVAKMHDAVDWCSELRGHFFTLNRLRPVFRDICASLTIQPR